MAILNEEADMAEGVTVVTVDYVGLDQDWDSILEVCLSAVATQPWLREEKPSANEFGLQLGRHSGREGFRAVKAMTSTGEVIGFAYGYGVAKGLVFPDLVAKAIGALKSEQYLTDCFTVTELVVRPEWRNKGIGSDLLGKLLAESGRSRAVLSVREDNAAIEFYQARGWKPILTGFRFPGGTAPFSIMAKQLG